VRLALLGFVRLKVVVVGFSSFVFRGTIAVVVFRVMLLMWLLGGERWTCKHSAKQNRGEKLLHISNRNMTLTAGHKAPVTSVPKEQSANRNRYGAKIRSGSSAVVRMMVMMMMVMSGEHRARKRQQQNNCKNLRHGKHPST
jgi:hypothetical protein